METMQTQDEIALSWFENRHQPWLNEAMKGITHLGDKWTAIGVVLTAALVFWLCGRRRTACIVVATSILGLGIAQGIKGVANRPRPDVAWRVVDRPHSPSFPSGHSLLSMAIYGAIGLLASRSLRHRAARWLVVVLGLGLPVLIGISRSYLGVHYPGDVLAGWTLGLGCALLAYWADRRYKPQLLVGESALNPSIQREAGDWTEIRRSRGTGDG